MRQRGLDVTYVSGGFAEAHQDLAGADIIQLPAVRAADATFDTLITESGAPADAVWEARRQAALLAAFQATQPDALLIESFPFGRRRFRFELLPLFEKATENRIPVAASVRDILVVKNDLKRINWVTEIVNEFFDTVIVHGDPSVVELGETFGGAAAITASIQYSGYVAPPPMNSTSPTRSGVVVSAGGGAVGGPLFRAALAAKPLSRFAHEPWRLITGPNLPESDRIMLNVTAGVTIDTYLEDFRGILCNAAVSVSQAGYNTVMDLFAARTRSVLVPFSQKGETEQFHRAKLLARRGHVQVVSEHDLSPQRLAAAIDSALDAAPPDPSEIDLNGAPKTAALMAELATGRSFSSRL